MFMFCCGLSSPDEMLNAFLEKQVGHTGQYLRYLFKAKNKDKSSSPANKTRSPLVFSRTRYCGITLRVCHGVRRKPSKKSPLAKLYVNVLLRTFGTFEMLNAFLEKQVGHTGQYLRYLFKAKNKDKSSSRANKNACREIFRAPLL